MATQAEQVTELSGLVDPFAQLVLRDGATHAPTEEDLALLQAYYLADDHADFHAQATPEDNVRTGLRLPFSLALGIHPARRWYPNDEPEVLHETFDRFVWWDTPEIAKGRGGEERRFAEHRMSHIVANAILYASVNDFRNNQLYVLNAVDVARAAGIFSRKERHTLVNGALLACVNRLG